MTPIEDMWGDINNIKALEAHLKILLAVLRSDRSSTNVMQMKCQRIWKDSGKSKYLRELGNQQYLKGDDSIYVNSAIEWFTKSIAYAPVGSTELSLAYANRSALLMKVRLYDDALMDITRALKAGYPDRLKAKLFLRRVLCLKAANSTAESDIEKALEDARKWLKRMSRRNPCRQMITDTLNDISRMAVLPPPRTKWDARRFLNGVFEDNPEIIDASSAIAIKPMKNNKIEIIATRDIKPGEIISTQEPYVALLHQNRRYTNCWHCRDQTLSSIPCNSCVFAVFCSETCRDFAWSEYHSIECQMVPLNTMVSSNSPHYEAVAMRLLLRAVKEAGSIQGLKKLIQRFERDSDLKRKGFTGSKFDGSKLSSIFGLPTYADTQHHDLQRLICQSLHIVCLMATQSNFFGEKMTVQRFQQHELVPFVASVLLRFILISIGNRQEGYDAENTSITNDNSVMIVPLHSHIAHSCAPNVSRCFFGSKEVLYAHYPIKRSEQIFQCRGLTFERYSKEERQAGITQIFGRSCCCVACTENWPHSDLPLCKTSGVSQDLLLAQAALLKTIDKRLELSTRGHFAVIAKLINDLSVIISDWWNNDDRPPCRAIAQAVELLNRIFFVLGNRRELFYEPL